MKTVRVGGEETEARARGKKPPKPKDTILFGEKELAKKRAVGAAQI